MTKKKFPLTSIQEDIYKDQLLYTDSCIYNIGGKIKIEGSIDLKKIKKAYSLLIQQNDAFRIQIIEENNHPCQIFNNLSSYELKIVDFSNEKDSKKSALMYMDGQFQIPFNIKEDQVLNRFMLIKVSDTLNYLFSVCHHIITDGWGISLMFTRLVKNYNELLNHGDIMLEYSYSYLGFIKDDQKYIGSETYEADFEYWKNKCKNLPDSIFASGKRSKLVSNRQSLSIEREDYNSIENLATQFNCSSFHVILGLLYSYFCRYYQINDLSVGIPVLNRRNSIFKKTVGLFMGLFPLRIRIDFNIPFSDLIIQIKQQLRLDYRHQRFPLGKLIQTKNIYNSKDKLFNIILSYEKHDYSNYFMNTKTKVVPFTHKSERVPLAVYIREFDSKTNVRIDFDYNLSYFDENSIIKLIFGIQKVLFQVSENPSIEIKNLQV